jgi:uncharacterized membrane protein YfhO
MLHNEAPLRSAFVEENGQPLRLGKMPSAKITTTEWHDAKVRFAVEAPEGGFLIVSMSWYPEWQALVDGKRAELFRVNGAIQGVAVNPGSREVTLIFQPRSLYAGMAAALAGILCLAGGIFHLRRTRSGQRP